MADVIGFFEDLDEIEAEAAGFFADLDDEDDASGFFAGLEDGPIAEMLLRYWHQGYEWDIAGDGDELNAFKAARYLSCDPKFTNVQIIVRDDAGTETVLWSQREIEAECERLRKKWLAEREKQKV